jgi:putative endonuclease
MFVYILKSTSTNKYYCGQTKDFEARIKRHNKGREKYTKSGVPWILVHKIEIRNRSEAIVMERKIKKRGIKRFLIDNLIGV